MYCGESASTVASGERICTFCAPRRETPPRNVIKYRRIFTYIIEISQRMSENLLAPPTVVIPLPCEPAGGYQTQPAAFFAAGPARGLQLHKKIF